MPHQTPSNENTAEDDGAPSEESQAVWLPAEQLIDQSPDAGVAAPETFPQEVDAAKLGPPEDDESQAPEGR